MTCLLKEMYLASSGDEPRYESVAWGETSTYPADSPKHEEVDYITADDCKGDRRKVVDPRLADCSRCLWFYQQFLEAETVKAMDAHQRALMAPFAFKVQK